jgi:hypothetical protein
MIETEELSKRKVFMEPCFCQSQGEGGIMMSDEEGGFGPDEGFSRRDPIPVPLLQRIQQRYSSYHVPGSDCYIMVNLGDFDSALRNRMAYVPVGQDIPGIQVKGEMNRLNFTHYQMSPEGILCHPDQAPPDSADFHPPAKMTLCELVLDGTQ